MATPILRLPQARLAKLTSSDIARQLSLELRCERQGQRERDPRRSSARAILDALMKLGRSESQLASAGYSVAPEVACKPAQVTGYIAHNAVQVDVQRVEQTGSLIDGAQGWRNTVNSLFFYSSQSDDRLCVAIADAVSKARPDAEAMASGRVRSDR